MSLSRWPRNTRKQRLVPPFISTHFINTLRASLFLLRQSFFSISFLESKKKKKKLFSLTRKAPEEKQDRRIALDSSSSMAAVAGSLAFTTTFLILLSFSEAREILVGGKTDAWNIPTSDAESLNAWAASSRFRIGDSLVWTYDGDKDSVLQVTRSNYLSCSTSNPIQEYKGGNTTVKLERSGPHYFISGAEGHCEKGEKLIVVVLSPRHTRHAVISPAPSPAEVEGPAAAPGPMSSSGVILQGGMVMGLGALVLLALF